MKNIVADQKIEACCSLGWTEDISPCGYKYSEKNINYIYKQGMAFRETKQVKNKEM